MFHVINNNWSTLFQHHLFLSVSKYFHSRNSLVRFSSVVNFECHTFILLLQISASQVGNWLIDHAGGPTPMKKSTRLLFCRIFEAQKESGISWTKMNSTSITEQRRNWEFRYLVFLCGSEIIWIIGDFGEQIRFLRYLGILGEEKMMLGRYKNVERQC